MDEQMIYLRVELVLRKRQGWMEVGSKRPIECCQAQSPAPHSMDQNVGTSGRHAGANNHWDQ